MAPSAALPLVLALAALLAALAWHAAARRARTAGPLARAFAEAPAGLAVIGADGRVRHANAALERLADGPLAGRGLDALRHEDDAEAVDRAVALVRGGELAAAELPVRLPGERWAELSLAPAGGGEVVVQVQDATDRREAEERLSRLANVDTLTGLWNRRRFNEELERQVARCRRYGERAALLLLDLDHFKEVNDTFGHKVGDDLIRAVADAMVDRLRSTDGLARLGGDEFAVLLTNVEPDDAAAVAQALGEEVAGRTLLVGDTTISATASIGLAFLDERTTSDQEALVQADLAMYDAKRAGRDRTGARFPGAGGGDDLQASGGLRLAQRVRDAIDEDRLIVVAQPVVDLLDGSPAMYELLVRLRDEDGRLLGPAAFLPTADRFGSIVAIDRWMLRHALAEQVRLAWAGHDVRLAVNLSRRSVADPTLPAYLTALLERHPSADAGRIVLEVSETEGAASLGQAEHLVGHARDLGFLLALDDFGAGIASFAALQRLPVDLVKLDGELVRALEGDDDALLVARALLDVARGMGKTTVAEWVSSPALEGLVRDLGVDLAQGYAMGRPAPLRQLLHHGGATSAEEQVPRVPVEVLHCDDSPAYRALVRALLGTRGDVLLVGESASHEAVLRDAARLAPDVVLLDAVAEDQRPDVIAELRRLVPDAAVVVLSGHAEGAVELGGEATWLRKTASADELADAVRDAARLRPARAA